MNLELVVLIGMWIVIGVFAIKIRRISRESKVTASMFLDGASYRYAGRRRGLLGGEDCEGNGPEAVIVRSLRVVEQDLPRLPELVAFYIELVVEVYVEGYVKVI